MNICPECEQEQDFDGVCGNCEEKLKSERIVERKIDIHDCIGCTVMLNLRWQAATEFLLAVGQRKWTR